MPPLPLPPELDDVVLRPNPAVVATVRSDGTPHSAATWYDWVDGRLLLNMDESRARLGHLRERPHISLTVFDGDNWGRLFVHFKFESATRGRGSTGGIANVCAIPPTGKSASSRPSC